MLTETAVAKVGVTTENNAHWGARANTFSVNANSTKYECINVPLSQVNAKMMEALAFARLHHLGLKVRSNN